METAFLVSFYFAIISGSLLAIYWLLAYPALALKTKAHTKRVSDRVKLMVLKGEFDLNDPEVQTLEYFREMAVRMCYSPSVSGRRFRNQEISPDLAEKLSTMKNAKDERVRDLFNELTRQMFARHIGAQPLTVLFLVIFGVAAVFSLKAWEKLVEVFFESWATPTSGSTAEGYAV